MASVIRTCRTACRKSTTPWKSSVGRRARRWTRPCAIFSKRTADRLPKPARWSIERMARIVLKIDVDTLRGTREGVPNLARMLDKYRARATFLFSLGPDHTGWALRRRFRPGFLKKVSRTSVVE